MTDETATRLLMQEKQTYCRINTKDRTAANIIVVAIENNRKKQTSEQLHELLIKNNLGKEIIMGKFQISETNKGYRFNLKASNGEVIATSEVYSSKRACLDGIESVKNNAPVAKIEDQTEEGFKSVTNPKFEVYADKAGEYRFRLKAKNGEIIAASEGYKAKKSCLNGIDSVVKNAPGASIE